MTGSATSEFGARSDLGRLAAELTAWHEPLDKERLEREHVSVEKNFQKDTHPYRMEMPVLWTIRLRRKQISAGAVQKTLGQRVCTFQYKEIGQFKLAASVFFRKYYQ